MFEVGDRVVRPRDVFDAGSSLMHGVVVARYSRPARRYGDSTVLGPYPELFAVEWDDGRIQQDFFSHGLRKERNACACTCTWGFDDKRRSIGACHGEA